jgi:hypothetical protein
MNSSKWTRREAVTMCAAGIAAPAAAAPAASYRIGNTTNTVGGWEKDVFLSLRRIVHPLLRRVLGEARGAEKAARRDRCALRDDLKRRSARNAF